MLIYPFNRTYVGGLKSTYAAMLNGSYVDKYKDSVDDIVSYMDDKGDVYCWSLQPRWYIYADRYPCNRCCGWMNNYISLSEQYENELKEMFLNNPPQWLVIDNYYETADFVDAGIENQYDFIHSNDMFTLYELNSGCKR